MQVQTSPPSGTATDIPTLARMVVDAPRGNRRQILESACRTLARTAKTDEERMRLADLLDEEIKRIDTVPATVLERVRARIKR